MDGFEKVQELVVSPIAAMFEGTLAVESGACGRLQLTTRLSNSASVTIRLRGLSKHGSSQTHA